MSNDLATLKAAYTPGHALPRGFYTSPEIYERDIRDYWNRAWIWVGHESQVSQQGDFFTFDYGPESIIVARNAQGDLNAFQNVCRHRGSRLCIEAQGKARVFSCPYHAWTYELDGRLRGAREMGEGFDPAQWGLLSVHLRNFEGLLFVSAAEIPPPIDAALDQVRPLVAPFGLTNTKVAHSASYTVPSDWKLAVENYMECYHCGPAHLDFARSHSIKDPARMNTGLIEALHARSAAAGLPVQMVMEASPIPLFYKRYPLYEGYETGSQSGAALAPLLGDLTGFDGGATDLQIGMVNNFLLYSDHAVGYRFIPTGAQETRIDVVWLVRADAEEGRDYDKDALTWLWHVTTLDDERIIRHNQDGVNSHHFRPGPLSQMEWGIRAFYDDYLRMLEG